MSEPRERIRVDASMLAFLRHTQNRTSAGDPIIEVLAPAEQEAQSDVWRSIKTPPVEGRRVLVWWPPGETQEAMAIAYLDDGMWLSPENGREYPRPAYWTPRPAPPDSLRVQPVPESNATEKP